MACLHRVLREWDRKRRSHDPGEPRNDPPTYAYLKRWRQLAIDGAGAPPIHVARTAAISAVSRSSDWAVNDRSGIEPDAASPAPVAFSDLLHRSASCCRSPTDRSTATRSWRGWPRRGDGRRCTLHSMPYTVYLSSTLADLEDERKAVQDALADQCVVKHSYRASEHALVESCLGDVAACQLYIAILGLRYGYVPPDRNPEGLSITELEYQHARSMRTPRHVFLKDPRAIAYTHTDAGTKEHPMGKIESFRERVARDQRPMIFSSIPQLREQVLKAFNDFKEQKSDGARFSSQGVPIGADPATLPDGGVFKDVDAVWCPELIVVPAGRFMMGSPDTDTSAYPEELPRHEVTIDSRFALGRYPVTFEEFDLFCDAARYPKPGDEGWDRGRRPVINVSWNDARAFIDWLSQNTSRPYRLPSEAEWEYACRAGTATRTYRGDTISVKHANYNQVHGRTTEVGSYPANPWGLYDMLGNVWEHVQDPYHDDYRGAPADGRPWLDDADLSKRVVRGGSFSYGAKDNRCAVRCDHDVATPDRQHGFRVARSI
jgi:formylglycine-generating enzyme required for sulfatase activity